MTEMPSPFIALRADERDNKQDLRITKKGILNDRDPKGILWFPYGGSMTGETLYAHVHPIRQKMCMEGPYCQVCGRHLTGKFTPWILNGGTDVDMNAEKIEQSHTILTTTPPTCTSCQQVAKSLCPHMASADHTPRLAVRSYRPYGLFGDIVNPNDGSVEQEMVLKFGTPVYNDALPFFVAKQLVVQIERYKVLD